MTVKDYIEQVIAPKLQGDGGWIEFRSLQGDELTVVFRGECAKCLILHRCVAWIEEQIQQDLRQTVKINAVRKRPYFQEV
ncbi:MAG: NifU family protein [Eubacterium sp.]|nr:NifU family protein [Eubacterium sp.]